jgi:hypothetical protein
MAVDQRKRQKKLAKKRAKRKKHLIQTRRESFGALVSDLGQMAVAAGSPVYQCLVPTELFEAGIGGVIVSRRMANGAIAASVFLVDVFCLGVKDAFFRVLSRGEFESFLEQGEELENVDPACARKLVEESVAYAQALGLSPHPDYQKAKKIFGDIDAQACPTSFTFGKDGKPFFVAGPHDTLTRSKHIVDTLASSCGPDGFHYMVGLGGFGAFDDDEFDEEFEDEYEEEEEEAGRT